MSKRRKNKSRLTETDVTTICEMQHKIDVYENYIIGMCGLIQRKGDLKYKFVIPLCGTPMDELVNNSWNGIQEMKKELIELKGVVETHGAE